MNVLNYQIFECKNSKNNLEKQTWVAFHGIGQTTSAFKTLQNQSNTKVFSFGLLNHTKQNDNSFSKKLKATGASGLVEEHNKAILEILEKSVQQKLIKINVIGFSMGVRPALQLVNFISKQTTPIQIEKIILVAPEALAVSFWYRFATQTLVGKSILNKVNTSRKVKKAILSISTILFSTSAQKLIQYQLCNDFDDLVRAWQSYRFFEVSEKQWKNICTTYQRQITLVVSRKDGFISHSRIQKFLRKTNTFSKVEQIEINVSHAVILKYFLKVFFKER